MDSLCLIFFLLLARKPNLENIQDENQFNNIKIQYRNEDMRNVTRATTFTIPGKGVKA
jgi:hypothetical protein